MARPKISTLAVVCALFVLAGVLAVFDVTTWHEGAPIPPDDIYTAKMRQLDDPLGLKLIWLQQQGYTNESSIEAISRRQHRSAGSRLAAQLAAPGAICSNTCFKARDGVCDEGRAGNLTLAGVNWVQCDLGTDCEDCGPWQGVQHGPAWSESVGPIAYLKLYNIQVRVRQVPVAPHFIFAFTDPKIDIDQSSHMTATGVVEGGISQVFYKVLHKRCNPRQPGTTGFVVDVGANFGWFSLLSAALGCSVVAIEPVPIFRAFMEYSAARNHLVHHMEVIPAVVAPNVTKTYTINAPLMEGAQWGASGMDVPNYPGIMQIPARAVRLDDLAYPLTSSLRSLKDAASSSSANTNKVTVTSSNSATAADASSDQPSTDGSKQSAASDAGSSGSSVGDGQQQQVLHSRLLARKAASGIDILKVDVEGREPDVFATAHRLLDSGNIRNIVMEYSPGYYYQASDRLMEMNLLPSLLLNFMRHNYSLVHMPWSIAHDARAARMTGGWGLPLPTMDAITSPQLAYDLWTTEQIRNGSLPGMFGPTSWPCPEMAKSGMSITEKGYERHAMHVAFHPKSFMTNFVFNTNVWATKDKSLQTQGTGLFNDKELFPFYYPADSLWFPLGATSDTHLFGLPWAYCEHIPAQYQVAHRCRCRNWDVCGSHQVAVQQCVLKKHTGYANIGDDKVDEILAAAAAATSAPGST